MVAKPLCPLYKNIIKPLDRARYPELRYLVDKLDKEKQKRIEQQNKENEFAEKAKQKVDREKAEKNKARDRNEIS